MSVAIELRYGVERCGGTFPSDGDVGALVERARGAFEGLRGVAAWRLAPTAAACSRAAARGFEATIEGLICAVECSRNTKGRGRF